MQHLTAALFPVILILSGALCQDQEVWQQWDQFKADYSRNYADNSEEDMRRQLFFDRYQQIQSHNSKYDQGLVTYKMGVNQFSDWTDEEIRSTRNNYLG